MTKAQISVVCLVLLSGVVGMLICGVVSSPRTFWIIPLNNTECKLEGLEIVSTGYTIKFDESHFSVAERNNGEPQLVVPILAKANFDLIANFKSCKNKKVSGESILPGSGYYLYLEKDSVSLDRRI